MKRSPVSSLSHRRGAFTLVELLVVIGIIALLISILLPALNRAKRAANSIKCMSNMRQIGMGMQMYMADHDGMYPVSLYFWSPTQGGARLGSLGQPEVWDIKIARYLGIKGPPVPTPWLNWNVASPIFQCPSDTRIGTPIAGGVQRSYTANPYKPYNAANRPGHGVIWCPDGNDWGTSTTNAMPSAATPNSGHPIRANMVKKPALTAAFYECWTMDPNGNRQWNPNGHGISPFLGQGPAGGIADQIIKGYQYHEQRLTVLFCDGHVAQIYAQDAWNKGEWGGKRLWARGDGTDPHSGNN
jgi:prepilin-type N-terminal cleavage/methylation domain-containing protein/prepilin-type processing-associated H-X9-DG protein